MWPFKKKENRIILNCDLDYLLAGMAFARDLKNKYPKQKPPQYQPSKIIQPKQLK